MIKKICLFFAFFAVLLNLNIFANAKEDFATAINTCNNYKIEGVIPHSGLMYNVLITLNKQKNACVYKEKIYIDKKYQMLTCKFDSAQQMYIANSMKEYNNVFQKQIAKNEIFSAKLTSNGDVFNKILANPKYCEITYSKAKN